MVRSNNKTIALFDSWYAQKNNSRGLKEQDVLLNLMHQGLFRNLGLKVMFLDTTFFSGFCQDSRDARLVSTVHANCCRSIVAKVADLSTVMDDWRRFKSLSANESSRFIWSPHDRCINSWRPWTIICSSFSICWVFFSRVFRTLTSGFNGSVICAGISVYVMYLHVLLICFKQISYISALTYDNCKCLLLSVHLILLFITSTIFAAYKNIM